MANLFESLRQGTEKLLGMPVLASEHGQQVDNLIIYVHWLMMALFVGWLGYFAYTLFRFHRSRNPKADYIGVRNHASNYIEVVVALVEAVILLFVAVPLWAKTVDKFPAEKDSIVVQVVAQQFAWNVRYPGKDGEFGAQDMKFVTSDNSFGVDPADPKGKDDIVTLNEVHVVINKPVIIRLSSKDVIHSFKVIAMRVTQDAIPGMRIPLHFTPTREGRYQINCAQLCGQGHASMASGYMVVQSQEEFDKWIAGQTPAAAGGGSFE
ncbi:MAG TPA: cytochrome c oxidase subunit II [Verrucomicrobiae bacterium]|jgi:cytochrome c oxidase subunit 2|nr:cytochrome c oxidase subunit II [Verrucomicrobiae bacterium]